MDDKYFDPDAMVGFPKRYVHEGCSDGKDSCLVVTKHTDGWVWICHRCHKMGFRPLKGLSPNQTVRFIKSLDVRPQMIQKAITLPEDFTTEIPAEGAAWLYKYISDTNIKQYRIGYSPSLERVVLPVYEENTLVYWQGRYLGTPSKVKPKYTNIKQSGKKYIYFSICGGSNKIVLVEDILSAIKIGKVCDVKALLGSYIPDALIFSLHYDWIWLWLDYDKALESLKYVSRFRTFGINCSSCITKQDPKEHSVNQIKKELLI